MSRNGSGVYTLPTGNPVVPSTTITTTWANNTLNDIASTLTQSVASDGQTPMTGNLNLNSHSINNVNVIDSVTSNSATVNAGDLNVTGLTTFYGSVHGGNFVTPTVTSILEPTVVSATAASGTINFDVLTSAIVYFTTAASANWVLNIRGNSTTSLNSSMAIGQSLSIAFLATQGSTAYYNTSITIDGTATTVKWQNGITPTYGDASSIDTYTYVIIKTAASTFTVLASQTKFA